MTSAVETRRKWALALVAFFTAFGLFAVAAVEKAGATEVLPSQAAANTTANVALQNGEISWFKPNNAYFQNAMAEVAVGCTTSTASFLIPPSAAGTWSLNQNKTNIGTHSTGPGGVIADIADGEPDFSGCSVYLNGAPIIAPVTVTTGGEWTVSAHAVSSTESIAAITVPSEDGSNGVTISIPTSGSTACVLNVVEDKPQSVLATIVNGDEENDAELLVDSQLKFLEDASSSGCAALGFDTTSGGGDGEAISQFEAKYNVTSNQGPFQVIP